MSDTQNSSLLASLGLGVVAGMRSMTAPALLSYSASQDNRPPLRNTPFELLQDPRASAALYAAALGEMVVDKLPMTPSRTLLPSVIFRALSGALVGASCAPTEQERVRGGVLGALGALGATYGMYHLRKELSETSCVPNTALGLGEDAIAVGSGLALLNLIHSG